MLWTTPIAMRPDRTTSPRNHSTRAAALVMLACAVASGCSGPLGSHWADFQTRREIERVAADDSFPTAAEIGLTPSADSSTDE